MAKTEAKTKKAAPKNADGKSGFAVMDSVKKAKDAVSEKAKVYNDKYLAKAVDKGRETVKEYNEKYVKKGIDKGKNYVEGPYKKFSEKVDKTLAKGRDMEKDWIKKFDEYVENGRKYMYKIPMVETLEKKVTSSFDNIPKMVNMPSKAEIEKLTLALESLNTSIESMKIQKMA